MFGKSWIAALPLLAAVEAQVVTSWLPNPNPVCTVQPYVVEYPVHIDTYISADTAIIINGGVTININNAPTTLVTDVIATSTELVPVATIVPGAPFLLALAPAAGPVKKRQALSASYIDPSGAVTPECSTAAAFALSNGQLESDGELVSTNAGVTSAPFTTSAIVGNISTTFALTGTTLTWTNAAFTGGAAAFCSLPDGTVVSVFTTAPVGTTCVPVNLVAVSPSSCISNGTSSPVPASTTSTPTSPSTNGTMPTTGVSSTTTSGVPTPSPSTAFALSFPFPAAAAKNKRQAAGQTTYIDATGGTTTDPTLAANFNVVDGELLSNGLLVSASVGDPFAVLVGSATPGDITTFFTEGTTLIWSNGNFTGGVATFAVSTTTLDVYAVFGTALPPGGVPVALTAIPISVLTSSSYASSTSISSTSSTGSVSITSIVPSTSSSTTSSVSVGPTSSVNGTAPVVKRAPLKFHEEYYN